MFFPFTFIIFRQPLWCRGLKKGPSTESLEVYRPSMFLSGKAARQKVTEKSLTIELAPMSPGLSSYRTNTPHPIPHYQQHSKPSMTTCSFFHPNHHHCRHRGLWAASIPLFIISPTPSSRPSRYLLLNSSQLRNRKFLRLPSAMTQKPSFQILFLSGFSIIFKSRATRLYESLCRSVCTSIGPSVSLILN